LAGFCTNVAEITSLLLIYRSIFLLNFNCSEEVSSGSLRSSHDGETVEKNNENKDDDPPIDPVMLKYMEMIKLRRETENQVHNLTCNQFAGTLKSPIK
jgi:hypothetical protein